ncbi:cellulose biosynthesis cyclic di-GMP-binding regulatory protein BcsB [Solimonas variicoloris]|uniref:cellulose biosynthesis cyclic di-GMP-binding regulatory protein BcsB n=1 Tax=Solimonas variicoloris TaxID=254408 RepID=UPI000A048947|nr:cellulose biosynthesis cyclic di-GMP-binding regulatory protein BcsB [Solimonas variicoloris]
MTTRRRPRSRWLSSAAACACAVTLAAAAAPEQPEALQPPARDVQIDFRELGVGSPLELRGVEGIAGVPLGIRLDEVATAATLHLRYTYSPALLPDLSHLRIRVNDEVIAAVPLDHEHAGVEVEREIPIDPAYFSDFNRLRFDLIGHYTRECEDPAHSSLWATISTGSRLDLRLRPLPLAPDLALLPAPFFDRRDNKRLDLPVLLPAKPSKELLRSAGVVASWFGVLAGYRGAHFPVSLDTLPDGHALVFATNAERPSGLDLPAVQAPTLSMLRNPQQPQAMLLVVQGADAAQLALAAEALVLGQAALSGPQTTVQKVELGQRRPAYDAPNWVRADRPVKLGELVDDPTDLQAHGHAPAPVRVNLRLPPDLLFWDRGIPLDLYYRYTPPAVRGNSMLSLSLNDQLIRSYALREAPTPGQDGNLLDGVLGDGSIVDHRRLEIPAFAIGSDNQLQFQYAIEYDKQGLCRGTFTDLLRAGIDADSTIDISSFAHYTALPDLALFANAGYPFTTYADLAETAVVLPDAPGAHDLETMLFLLGRMGRITGAPALRVRIADSHDLASLHDADLLVIGRGRNGDLLSQWGHELSLTIEDAKRQFRNAPVPPSMKANALQPDPHRAAERSVSLRTTGHLAAFLAFESPLRPGRSVVALVANTVPAQDALIEALDSPGMIRDIRGDTAIVREHEVASFASERPYYVGDLSLWRRIWFHLARHPGLLLLLALVAGFLSAFGIYGYLRRRAETRLRAE